MAENIKPKWESLRRSLRGCHDALDTKLTELHSIQRLAQTSSGQARDALGTVIVNDVDHLRAQTQEISIEVEALLKQAQSFLEAMNLDQDHSVVQAAQLQRLQGITSNLNKEYEQTVAMITQHLDRKSMLRPSSHHSYAEGHAAKYHFAEQTKLRSSLSLIEQATNLGRDVVINLSAQKRHLTSSRTMLGKMTHRMSKVKGVMNVIKRIQVKHTVILACVVGICLLICMLRLL